MHPRPQVTNRMSQLTWLAALGAVASFVLFGVARANPTTLCNTGLISIPSTGASTPYPSTVNVSGLDPSISTVKVTLNDANHTYRSDLDILLVGPHGQSAMLMFGAGSSGDLIHATITFDDSAATPVPTFGNITGTNSYLPTNPFPEAIPSPAPAMPYGTDLSSFGGTDPNGTWSLYIYDSSAGDFGEISGGWCLTITTGVPSPGQLSLSSDTYRAPEGTSDVITVNRTGGAAGAVSVSYATSDSTATSGSDYTPATGTLSWADGDNAPKTFPVPLLADVISEGNPEVFHLTLSSPTGGATLGSRSTALGVIKDVATLYRNGAAITLPVVGPGTPYPSTITVSGAPTMVKRVRVSLYGITHGNIGDIDALLVAPNGKSFVVMSDVSSGVSGFDFAVTLEDSATDFLPKNSVFDPVFNYKPSNYDPLSNPIDDFSGGGGPPPPYGLPGPGATETFASSFDGINPNGDWKLYILDDTNGISGTVAGGWGMDFLPAGTVGVPAGPGGRENRLWLKASRNPMRAGEGSMLAFGMPAAGRVRVEAFDLSGRRVAALVDESLRAGEHSIRWTGRNSNGDFVASGLYLVRVSALGSHATTSVMVVK